MYSQNGWKVDRSVIARYTIPETSIHINLRRGDASVVLLWLAGQYHKHVEPLTQADTGGFVIKGIEGGRSLSNHASGTAMDLRWNKHVMGRRGTFTAQQVATIRRMLSLLDGAVRWGGDYVTRADEMHFEVVASATKLRMVADKIRAGKMGTVVVTTKPKPKPESTNVTTFTEAEARKFQANMNRIFPAYKSTPLTVDGTPGPKTVAALKEFQVRTDLKPDGIAGSKTRAMLKKYHVL